MRIYRNQLELINPFYVFIMCCSYSKISEGPIENSGNAAVTEVFLYIIFRLLEE